MIGFLDVPSGRMGNVLIQYMFMRQLAERIGIDYFHVKLPYNQYFEGFGRRNVSLDLLFSKKWRVNLKYIESMGINAFITQALDKSREGYTIVLEPPVLGHLFEFKEDNPARFLRIKNQHQYEVENLENRTLVGLHFRGGDFKAWNSMASLSADYYRDSICYILKNFDRDPSEMRWLLFTDDNCLSAYCDTLEYLQSKGLEFIAGDADNSLLEDFCKLSQCDYIVSSPSTYAIVAAIMGKEDKMIIHNKEWVIYCASKGERFWKDIYENNVPWYQVVALL